MTDKEIIDFIRKTKKEKPFVYSMILFSKNNLEISNFIYENTKFLNCIENLNKKTRIYCILNNIKELPKCKACGKTIYRNINNHTNRFAVYCSPKCENSDPEVVKKANNTCIEKYGCKWSFQSENNKEKTKNTMLRKYGVEYAQQNKNIKNKSYETMLKKYGCKTPFESKEIFEKRKISKRKTSYGRFLKSSEIIPLFSEDDYVNYGEKHDYKWKCTRCGTEFESTVNMSWFKQGQNRTYARCTACYPDCHHTSSGEEDLKIFIESVYDGVIEYNSRCLSVDGHKYEIDINLIEKNIGFEYNGLFFHSEKCGKGRDYHVNKTEIAEKNGIQLIHIFENEWMNKKDIVKSRIKNLLGVYDKVVYGRKCSVKTLDRNTTNEFIDGCHIQGSCPSSVNLGLFHGDELVSVMTFGKSRFNKKYEWELLRFCNKLGYHVTGGAGKLLKYFERNYNPKSLVSYADRRWSKGNLYKKLGFNFVGNSKPNYWYFKGVKIESRIKYQKHKLKDVLKCFDIKKSEWENMSDNGYNRIFDCGNMVFEMLF